MLIRPLIFTVAKILSFALYVVLLLAAFGGKFNPEYFTFPSMVTLALPYLTILTLGIVISWACSRRFFTAGIGAACLLLSFGAIQMATPISFPKKAPEGAKTFSLMTFNCLHCDDLTQPDYDGNRPIEYFIKCGADIICFQELLTFFEDSEMQHDVSPALLDSLYTVYPYKAKFNYKYSDLKVLSKYPVEPDYSFSTPDENPSKYAFFRVHIGGTTLRLVNVHLTSFNLSTEERKIVTGIRNMEQAKSSVKEFKTSIYSKMKYSFAERAKVANDIISQIKHVGGPIIVCGDFNDVPASYTYRQFISDGFHDAYSETSFGPIVTYNKHLFFFHLDQILYRGPLQALNAKKMKLDSSDHNPVMATFAILPE